MMIFFLPLSDPITTVLYRLLVVRFCTVRFDKLVQTCVCMHVLILCPLIKFSKLIPLLLFSFSLLLFLFIPTEKLEKMKLHLAPVYLLL